MKHDMERNTVENAVQKEVANRERLGGLGHPDPECAASRSSF